MANPFAARMAGVIATSGARLRPGGLDNLLSFLASENGLNAFVKWRQDPMTARMIDAIRTMAVNPSPAAIESSDIPVQYGMTTGFQTAAQIMDDPTAVFPAVFSQGFEPLGAPTYDTPPEGFLAAPDQEA